MMNICGECGMVCTTQEVDNGVGVTEYGSYRYNHVDYEEVSKCCGTSDLLDYETAFLIFGDSFTQRSLF